MKLLGILTIFLLDQTVQEESSLSDQLCDVNDDCANFDQKKYCYEHKSLCV